MVALAPCAIDYGAYTASALFCVCSVWCHVKCMQLFFQCMFYSFWSACFLFVLSMILITNYCYLVLMLKTMGKKHQAYLIMEKKASLNGFSV